MDQPGQVIDVYVPIHPGALDEVLPGAFDNTVKDANSRIENDHGRLTARLRPRPGLKLDHSAPIMVAGHTMIQNLRLGHRALALLRLETAFAELGSTI